MLEAVRPLMRGGMRIAIVTMTVAVPGALAWAAPPALAADPVVAAVGDLGCGPGDPAYNNANGTATDCRQRAVSDLLVGMNPNALLLPGDTQYETGQLANYQTVFNPTYGRLNGVAYPVPGNVEYDDGANAAPGYYTYFTQRGVLGRIASTGTGGNPSKGYYSFNIGNWHIIGLNSNCEYTGVGGCGPGSTQETWLRKDLASNTAGRCILAFAHHARWNSGTVQDDARLATFWEDLYAARADIVLSGHANHHYERHAPQNPDGSPDGDGIREFIVSTGGEHHGTPPPPNAVGNTDTLEAVNYTRFGALKLTLHQISYDWQFVAEGGGYSDSGSGSCHTPGPPSDGGGDGTGAGGGGGLTGDGRAGGLPNDPLSSAARSATELSVTTARIVRGTRMLEIDGSVPSQATGRVAAVLSAAGHRTRASAPISGHRFRIGKHVAVAQLAGGIVTLRYAGDDRTRPLSIRLRAASKPAKLTLKRPTLSGGRLRASGTVAANATGVVQVQLEYDYLGATRTLKFKARIIRGAWKLDARLGDATLAQIDGRTGTLHSYTLYSGSRRAGISGQLRSFRVLGGG